MKGNDTSNCISVLFMIVAMWIAVYLLENKDTIITSSEPETEFLESETVYVEPEPEPETKPKPKKKFGTHISVHELHEVFLEIINRENSKNK